MRFEFATATRIVFGPGTLPEAAAAARASGRRALVVTGRQTERAEPLLRALTVQGLEHSTFPVPGEPTVGRVQEGVRQAQAQSCDVVIAFGGGSAIDAGKAIAGLCTNPGEVLDYLEVVGRGRPLEKPAAPFIAVPTTAGAGAEVTRNAVLASPEHKVKASLRSSYLLARLAVVDPELTANLPPAITASTGLDALTQLIEPYVCARPNPFVDSLCREGMRRVARSLRTAVTRGEDRSAREDMALASLFSGLALANAGLGAVHGFAAPIGGMFPARHGAVCAALLPHVMEVNQRALQQRQPSSDSLRRYEEVARILTGRPAASAQDGVHWVRTVCQELQIPPLRQHGLQQSDFPVLVEKASAASSMKANPLPLTREELVEILERAF
jgi:alcohol dehydrogenase class IV